MHLPQTQTSLSLSDSGLLALKEWILETALGSLLLGVQATLSIVVLYVFVAQGIPLSKARLALSVVIIMMFLASLSSLVMDIEAIIIQILLNGYNPPDSKEAISLVTELEIACNFLGRLNFFMGDMIVVWRAWVLFPQRLPARIALSICLMGSFVFLIRSQWIGYLAVALTLDSTTNITVNVYFQIMPELVSTLNRPFIQFSLSLWLHITITSQQV
ncbi:hypothetical protein K435DRAFT_809087 [Dendrothele bispora CBS 962.96]|uniref:Uncharacterized protein n=1 Tax=Dendrothele bispora (strain CBS 962.96) TaxID=1314807 RepID=A0A4S8KZD2_DENBC|nr:hypothetical protein K435DRAFT_809087 [Dendrothele bispora CBS 962.96]